MSKFLAGAMVCALLIAAGGSVARASVQTDVLNMDKQYRDAVVARDLATLGRILSKDFTATTEEGQHYNKAQYLAWLKNGKTSLSRFEPVSEYDVRVHGHTAVVNGVQSISGRFVRSGKTVQLQVLSRATRIWVRQGDAWRLVSSVWHHLKSK